MISVIKWIINLFAALVVTAIILKVSHDDRVKDPYASIVMIFAIIVTVFIMRKVNALF